MENINTRYFHSGKAMQFASLLFVGLILWRIVLFFMPATEGFSPWSFAWGAAYQIIAIWGGIWGLITVRSWGARSLLGKIIIAFSVGLLLQAFGQSAYSYYIYTTGNVLYPSIGDIGFFGSIFFYLYGVVHIAKLVRVQSSSSSPVHKVISVIIPLAMLLGSCVLFLRGYTYDWSHPVTVFLDFGYPLGQALYVAIAVLALIVIYSRQALGGFLKTPLLFFLAALVMQYVSDFTFLYQASRGFYIAEGINDCMYLVAYFLMAVSLIQLEVTFEKINGSK